MITLLSLLLACGSGTTFSGTLVGNPGKGRAMIGRSDGGNPNARQSLEDDIQYLTATAVLEYSFYGAGDIERAREIQQEIDLLNPQSTFPILSGSWEYVAFEFSTGPQIEGSLSNGQSFRLEIPPIELFFDTDGAGPIEEAEYNIELGAPSWFNEQQIMDFYGLEEPTDETLLLHESEELLELLQNELVNSSGFFMDADKDGSIDSEERDGNSVGQSVSATEDFEDEENDRMWGFWDDVFGEDDDDD